MKCVIYAQIIYETLTQQDCLTADTHAPMCPHYCASTTCSHDHVCIPFPLDFFFFFFGDSGLKGWGWVGAAVTVSL